MSGKYVIFMWPDSQELMERKGFEEHCFLAPDDVFGSSAYFVDEDWLIENSQIINQ